MCKYRLLLGGRHLEFFGESHCLERQAGVVLELPFFAVIVQVCYMPQAGCLVALDVYTCAPSKKKIVYMKKPWSKVKKKWWCPIPISMAYQQLSLLQNKLPKTVFLILCCIIRRHRLLAEVAKRCGCPKVKMRQVLKNIQLNASFLT